MKKVSTQRAAISRSLKKVGDWKSQNELFISKHKVNIKEVFKAEKHKEESIKIVEEKKDVKPNKVLFLVNYI